MHTMQAELTSAACHSSVSRRPRVFVVAEPSSMSSEEIFHLPLNVYIIILGIGLFVLMLSLIFCCYLFRYARHTRRDCTLSCCSWVV